VCDVQNAGGIVVYDGDQTAATYVDGGLISGRHPGVVEAFLSAFLAELEKPAEAETRPLRRAS
jgi:hypothetical protein